MQYGSSEPSRGRREQHSQRHLVSCMRCSKEQHLQNLTVHIRGSASCRLKEGNAVNASSAVQCRDLENAPCSEAQELGQVRALEA